MTYLLFFMLYLFQYACISAGRVSIQKISLPTIRKMVLNKKTISTSNKYILSKVNNNASNFKNRYKNTVKGKFEMGISDNIKSSIFPISTKLYDSLADINLSRISKESLESQQNSLRNMKKNSVIRLTNAYIPIFREYLLPYIKKPCVLLLTARNDITIPEELYVDDIPGEKYGMSKYFQGVKTYNNLTDILDTETQILLSNLCSSKKDCLKRKDFEAVVENKFVKHLFVTNLDYPDHPKLSPLPIGVSSSSLKGKNRIMDFNYFLMKQTSKRHKKVFVESNFSGNRNSSKNERFKYWKSIGYQTREEVFKIFKNTKRKDFTFITKERLKGEEYWAEKAKYAFALSPIGHGMDCFRTYESILAGQIVITQSSPLNKMYKDLGLPIIIVDDYKEVTAEKLFTWLKMYPDVMTNDKYRSKLKRKYWEDRIKSHFDE